MEELEQRRLMLNKLFDRMKVLAMIETAMAQAMQPSIPLDERRLYKELVTELTEQLSIFGDKANQSLQVLVQALPPVPEPSRLLKGGE